MRYCEPKLPLATFTMFGTFFVQPARENKREQTSWNEEVVFWGGLHCSCERVDSFKSKEGK